ncbi:MAG TPA: patatin-like phospholipase family protein [Cytophagales bacterium]|nr:patatin-like phospholipase family protein [Cytophagales bacterium]
MRRALITSGGGAKGAFTVGALKHLAKVGIDTFDIVSGTSTGSLIASMAAIGEIDLLEQVYSTVTNQDILLQQNIVQNLTNNKPFIFDTEPLRELIVKHITDSVFQKIVQSNTTLCLSGISLQNGALTVFSTKDLPPTADYNTIKINTKKELVDAMVASSSQAGFLPPVNINGEQFVDGGNREVIPTRIAVNLLPDEIFVISNNPNRIFPTTENYTNILKVLMRAIAIFIQEVRENDMAVLRLYAAKSGAKVTIIEPEEDLDPEYPTGLRFNQLAMTNWIKKGELRAKKILDQGGIV